MATGDPTKCYLFLKNIRYADGTVLLVDTEKIKGNSRD